MYLFLYSKNVVPEMLLLFKEESIELGRVGTITIGDLGKEFRTNR